MNDRPLQSESEADASLDRLLETLPAFTPRPGFDDRVMARVRRPSPLAIRRAQAMVRVLGSRGAWALAAASAAGTILWSSMAASWLTANSYAIRSGVAGLVAELAVPLWREILRSLLPAALSVVNYVLSGTLLPAMFSAAVIGIFLPPVCAWGLHRLMRPPRTGRVYATR